MSRHDLVENSVRRARPLLGTIVEVAVFDRGGDYERAIEAAFAAIAKVHRLMSFHEADSDVSRLNRGAAAEAVAVDPWTFDVLRLAANLQARSNGAFDITVAPVLQEIGRLPRHEHCPPVPRRSADRNVIEFLPDHRIRFRSAACIDLGGIAKGFAVDRAIDALKRHGLAAGLVNAGGDVAAFGPMPQVVHLRHPDDAGVLTCAVALADRALATSGGTFDPLTSHAAASSCVVDPRSGQPPAARGAAVQAPSCMVADALTKVVMIDRDTAAALLSEFEAAALIVSAAGQVSVSPGWQGCGPA